MTDPSGQDTAPGPAPSPASPSSSRRRPWAVAVVVIALLGVGIFAFIAGKQDEVRRPAFPSLQSTPDAMLKGTIAYLDGKSEPCVRVTSASGAWRNGTLQWCAPGRTLRWRDDGRLEHLEYSADTDTKGRPATERANGSPVGGQVIDVSAGTVEPVAAADMPASPPAAADPTVGPNSQRTIVTNDGGHVTLVVDGPSGKRTLLTADGGRLYQLQVLGWSPDGSWILASDGRLLVITVDHPTTRVLSEDYVGGGQEEPPAITGADVAPPTK